MKKIILCLSLYCICLAVPSSAQSFADTTQKKPSKKNETTVYICNSKTSYAYHTSNSCRGLNRCTHQLVKMTEADARAAGRTPCKICH